MKLYLSCPICFKDPERQKLAFPAELSDSRICDVTCSYGHQTKTVVLNLKYELLFESGASALAEGYPREAVASFAASIERYYEWITKVMLAAAGVPVEAVEEGWKRIKGQSERQLGAFRFLFLREFRKPAPHMEKWTEFRNGVIHKGEFPREQKAVEYGQACIEHVKEIASALEDRHRVAGTKLASDEDDANFQSLPSGPYMGFMTRTILGDLDVDLDDWLKEKRDKIHFQRQGIRSDGSLDYTKMKFSK